MPRPLSKEPPELVLLTFLCDAAGPVQKKLSEVTLIPYISDRECWLTLFARYQCECGETHESKVAERATEDCE